MQSSAVADRFPEPLQTAAWVWNRASIQQTAVARKRADDATSDNCRTTAIEKVLRKVTVQPEPEWSKTTKYCSACYMPRRVATGTDPHLSSRGA